MVSSDGASRPLFADVLVPRHINRTFTYAVPPGLREAIRIGSLVKVPFGASLLQAVVVGLTAAPPRGALVHAVKRFRDVAALLDGTGAEGLTAEFLELSRQVADYYLAPWGQCLRLVLPPPVAPSTRRRKAGADSAASRPPAQEAVGLEALPALPASQDWPGSAQEHIQAPFRLIQGPLPYRLAAFLEAGGQALAQGRSVLIISPDIAQAEFIAGHARRHLTAPLTLFHSGLPPRVRSEAWRELQAGGARVLVGTRSAVFAPMPALGVICVDQEEDAALKEEQEPRYHAREVAGMRARQRDARLLLGSAHPSLETWQACGGRPALVGAPPPPQIDLLDMRQQPYGTLLSQPMLDGVRNAVEGGARALLFLNRKGFAPALLCRDCGQALRCPACTVALTYFRKTARLGCRYCGLSQPLPDVCPACQAPRLEPIGSGTEKLEEMLQRAFPQATILRLDRERAQTPARAEALRREAAADRWDILIGTQMLFQGSPPPPVGFVGVPQADDGLHVADFRAAERTYHALLDAVSLARPGLSEGRVLLQSHMPEHHAIAAVAAGRPDLFYEQELAFRQALGYPPAAHLISLRVSGKEAGAVQQAAKRWSKLLLASTTATGAADGTDLAQTTVLGPVPATHAQLRGRHRWQLLVKTGEAEAGRRAVRATLEKLEGKGRKSGLKYEVDVDPLEMA